jgi:mannose/fructose-specific phosphotransferase system component IIA
MKNKYATFILTHEQMAICLHKGIEKILGKQKNVFPYTNLVDALPVLAKKIGQDIQDLQPDHIVCFVDLAGGSCWSLAGMIRKKYPGTTIIAGVNMPMLVSYFSNLNDLTFEALIKKVIIDGSRGIVLAQGAA